MTVEPARATWTDERLDDLSRRVEDGFNRVCEDLRTLRIELGGRIDRVDQRIDEQGAEISQRIDEQGAGLSRRIDEQETGLSRRIDEQGTGLSRRIDSLQRTMILLGGTANAGIIATLVSVVLTRA